MKNLRVYAPLVDGSEMPFEFSSGKDLIVTFVGDDWAAPPRCLVFEGRTSDGKIVRISVPFDKSDVVGVHITDE